MEFTTDTQVKVKTEPEPEPEPEPGPGEGSSDTSMFSALQSELESMKRSAKLLRKRILPIRKRLQKRMEAERVQRLQCGSFVLEMDVDSGSDSDETGDAGVHPRSRARAFRRRAVRELLHEQPARKTQAPQAELPPRRCQPKQLGHGIVNHCKKIYTFKSF